MSDRSMWKVWRCYKKVHAQPCWNGRCVCGWATAFDFSKEDVLRYLAEHECRHE